MTCILLCMHYETLDFLDGCLHGFLKHRYLCAGSRLKIVGGRAVRGHFYGRQLANCRTFVCYHQLDWTAMYLTHSTLNNKKHGRRKREKLYDTRHTGTDIGRSSPLYVNWEH